MQERPAAARRVVETAREHIAFGARVATDPRHDAPPREARARRLVYGMALPFGVLRATLRDPHAKRRYLKVVGVQLALMIPMAVLATLGMSETHELLTAHDAKGTLEALGALAAAIYSALCAIEWALIALGREYHEDLSNLCAARTGMPPQPLARPPRVSVDFGWLWLKLKRRVRGALLLAAGLPIAMLAWMLPALGDFFYAVLTAAWGFYWLAVFAVASTPLAWEQRGRDPWFLRAADALGTVPVLGWLPRLYARVWRKIARPVFPACVSWEIAPWESAGLAIARAVMSLPGIYMIVRPVFPVAAAHVVLTRAPPSGRPPVSA